MWVRFWDSSAKLKFFGQFTGGFLMNLFNYVRAIFFLGNFIVVLHITRICRHIEVCARGEHSIKCVFHVGNLSCDSESRDNISVAVMFNGRFISVIFSEGEISFSGS